MLVSSVLLGRLDTIALAAVSVAGIWTSVTDVLFFSGRHGRNECCWFLALFFCVFGTGLFVGNWSFLQNLFVRPKSVERC